MRNDAIIDAEFSVPGQSTALVPFESSYRDPEDPQWIQDLYRRDDSGYLDFMIFRAKIHMRLYNLKVKKTGSAFKWRIWA
jgi:hypothetical protein